MPREEDAIPADLSELMTHSMVEEEIFYPACKGKIEDVDVLEEVYVEHDGATLRGPARPRT
jgi:hypothetical protein